MFDPVEFILLARRLSADAPASGEVPAISSSTRVRAAYGRAYYGLYLGVRTEIVNRYRVNQRKLNHGALYTHLQSPRAATEVKSVGRELQRLYTLRQKADYELAPTDPWRGHLDDAVLATTLAEQALVLSRMLPRLDFSSVISLF
ncbi:MAG TPA: hypothetical protein VM890_01565 [Longimicrobium sp.]|nr:hypothetical protein [Longimicrobium sp.]